MTVIDLAAVRARRAAADAIAQAYLAAIQDRARRAAEEVFATVTAEPGLTHAFVEDVYLAALWALVDEMQIDLQAAGVSDAVVSDVALPIAATFEERVDELVADLPARGCDVSPAERSGGGLHGGGGPSSTSLPQPLRLIGRIPPG